MLTLVLVLTACSRGTPSSDDALGVVNAPGVEPFPTDPALTDPDPDARHHPEQERGTDVPRSPPRPARAELTVHAEQVEVTLPFVLIQAPELGFSTYVFEEFKVESTGSSPSGLRVSDPRRTTFIEVTAFPGGTTEEAALVALHEIASDGDALVQPGVPVRPWAIDSVLIDHGGHAEVYHLLEHAGRYLLLRQHFAWADAERFAPVLEGFLNEWIWDDGEYLVPR